MGTSAVYRRAALEPQGGPTLIPYAEDVHTGLDVRRAGWKMIYLPILLSAGICPDNLDAFVRQQYRWCTGNAGVLFSERLWSVRMSFPARLTYLSGFLYYAYTGLLTFFGPVIPIVMLVFLPDDIRLKNFLVLIPAVLTAFILYPLWHRSRYGPSVWPLGLARGWAHVSPSPTAPAARPWAGIRPGPRAVRCGASGSGSPRGAAAWRWRGRRWPSGGRWRTGRSSP